MRGSATKTRFGFIPNFLVNKLLIPENIQKNLKNNFRTLLVLEIIGFYDLIRERILKPTYRSFPINFKIWFDKVRYKI